VVFAQDFTHNPGALFMGGVMADAHIVHRVQNAAVDRFEAIPSVG
jgi:hypothetical protein